MRWFTIGLMFATFVVVSSKDANAAGWKIIRKSNTATYYADMDSAKTVAGGSYKSIRTRTEFKQAHYGNGKRYQSLKQLVYIDCAHQQMATKSVDAYKHLDTHGTPVFSVSYKDYMLAFSAEPPGSVGDTLIKDLCRH